MHHSTLREFIPGSERLLAMLRERNASFKVPRGQEPMEIMVIEKRAQEPVFVSGIGAYERSGSGDSTMSGGGGWNTRESHAFHNSGGWK